MLSIGIDIGGTKLSAGVVDPQGRILSKTTVATPSTDPQQVEDTICAVVADLGTDLPITAVGVGAAGWIDAEHSLVRFSPHLAWRNEPLQQRLQARLPVPVLVDNDANAAAWAEYRFGAGCDSRVMVMITLGTGIGGAMVVNGSLFRGRYGMAGEFGHMTVVPDGHRCPCGNRGCWEQYSSGNSLLREARAILEAGGPRAETLLDHVKDRDPAQLTGPGITDAALAGNQVAVELLAQMGTWLGRGLANVAAAVDPDTFVIGGGVSGAGDLVLAPAVHTFGTQLAGRGFRPPATIVLAGLRHDAGMVGAADLARHSLAEPPGPGRAFWPRLRRRRRRRTLRLGREAARD
ncbi:ROK family glucokinase [Propionibacteriaceae bacterium Y1923]|uniref:ROK family glucokinase n=1 Tax=Aestuariimicrobium sp. Y1814 TaxID=3418742 RepID=UPI003C1D9892